MANPTLTQYASAGDGTVRNGSQATWAAARGNASGTAAQYTNASNFGCYVGKNGASDWDCHRGFLAFDLSSIPAGSVVLSATLSVYASDKYDLLGSGGWGVVSGTQASTTTLATSDFSLVGSTEFATRKTFASTSIVAYTDFALNASGLAHLQAAVGGTARFALRTGRDIDNTTPASVNYEGVLVYFSEQTGTANDPKLTVVYSLDRAATDSISFTDSPTGVDTTPSGGSVTRRRWGADAFALSDGSQPYWRASRQPVVVRAAGANSVTAGGSQTLPLATINVGSTTGFASSGTAYIATTDFATTSSFTYTGITGTTFTGCSGGSGTFATSSMVAAADAESHFPQVTLLDDTDTPAIMVSYQQKPMHGHPSANKLCAKKSVKGGVDFASLPEYTIRSAPVNSGYGIGAHMVARLKNDRLLMIWYEGNGSLGYVKAYMSYTDGDPLVEANWSTPVRLTSPYHADYCATGSQYILYEGAGSNSTYGDLYVTTYGRSTLPSGNLSTRMAKITDGGAGGTWTDVSLIADYAGSGSTTQFTEVGLVALDTGTWLAHIRGEDDLDRWQASSTDRGATWGSLTKIITDLANQPALVQMPEGHVISQGSDVGGRGASGRTITFISTDRGATWPSTYWRLEETDATYTIYNGSDLDITESASVPARRVVNAYAQEKSTQAGAQVKFQWYAVPNFPVLYDAIAFTDTATQRIAAAFKTGADAIAFTDTATRIRAAGRTGADTLTLTDTATAQRVTLRDAADALAWTDVGSRSSGTASKTGADTVTFTDAGSGTVFATSAITIHPQGMVPGAAIAAYLRWEWKGPVAAKLNAGPGAAVAETTVSDGLTATFALAPGEYVAYSPAYPTRRLFFMVTE